MLLRLRSMACRFWSSSEAVRLRSSASAERYSFPIDSMILLVSVRSRVFALWMAASTLATSGWLAVRVCSSRAFSEFSVAELLLDFLNGGVLRHAGQRVDARRIGRDPGELTMLRFLLQAVHLRLRRRVVQRVQAIDDDVLAIVEGHGVLPLLVVRHRPLGRFDLLPLLVELFLQPVQRAVGVLQLRVEVLLHVLARDRVRGFARSIRDRARNR